MKNKIQAWFTTTRLIVYGVLSGIVLIGAVIVTLSSGVRAVGHQIERADSCAFERWYAPKDQVRMARETELYYTGMRTQYLLQELVSDEERERAENKFRSDSIRWSRGNIK